MSSTTFSAKTMWRGYQQLPEPSLAFDPHDVTQRALNPLLGLRNYGPYSQSTMHGFRDTIRIAVICEERDYGYLRQILNQAHKAHRPTERTPYLPEFPGVRSAFGVGLERADLAPRLPADLEGKLTNANDPHELLANEITGRITALHLQRTQFDVVAIYIPKRYAACFFAPGFDLHDRIKTHAAALGIPTQLITDHALEYSDRASVAWRLSTALYAKAGGVPWKLDMDTGYLERESAYIGLSYAIRKDESGKHEFITCCSQVFDADGGGMEFTAYEVSPDRKLPNPHLDRSEMRTVMGRTLDLYQRRHRGRSPERVVIHKQTPFLDDELDGCFDVWYGAGADLSCVQVTKTPWRAVLLEPPKSGFSTPNPAYATGRGTTVQLDGNSILVWVSGDSPSATLDGKKNWFQGGKGTPRPLLLTRAAGSGPLTDLAGQVLALSKMNWNNDGLYDSLPSTISYAQTLAKAVKHSNKLSSLPYDYRLFM